MSEGVDAFSASFTSHRPPALKNLWSHVHEDGAVAVRFRRALLAKNVDNRRNVMLDFCQQLRGRESWIGVELAIEDSVNGAL